MNTRQPEHDLPAGALVGYDRTAVAGYALDWAADHAAEEGRPLVVGRHEPTGLHQSPFGRVRSSVVDRSPCPTTVVPVHVSEPA